MNSSPAPLYGLVLAGGRSERMGRDKALLAYHGEPQADYAARLLAPVCEAVFLSLRPDQHFDALTNWPVIPDRYTDIGPLAGVLSAMEAHPHVAWLVFACDLPDVDAPLLARLADGRNPTCLATAFQADGMPEPLCAIYEPTAYPLLKAALQAGRTSLRRFLEETTTARLTPPDARRLVSRNHPPSPS